MSSFGEQVAQIWYLVVCEQAAPLRIGQRNDGLGAFAHPRLSASKGGPSSVQRSAAPRLGTNNRYR